ncbi:MAG: hypothetical protein ACTSRP_10305 [Candidatus Helarchaeota archaeon]
MNVKYYFELFFCSIHVLISFSPIISNNFFVSTASITSFRPTASITSFRPTASITSFRPTASITSFSSHQL